MKRLISYLGILTALALIAGPGVDARAQITLRGELGLDLENYGFGKSLKDTTRHFSVNRSLSNHFLDLTAMGPLVSTDFANFSARALMFGTYYSVKTDSGQADSYLTPSIPTYTGSVSLFPKRAYPLRLYYNKLRSHSLRYERNNQSTLDLASPELAIVRRYQSDIKSRGALWKLSIAENANFTSEVKRDDILVRRNYDFDEDQNIWVDFLTFRLIPTKPVDTITVINSIADDTVVVFVDLQRITSLVPNESYVFAVDSGFHEVEFIPRKRRAFRKRLEIRGDMRWRILYRTPAAPNDTDQRTDAATMHLRIGNGGPFISETYYEYNASDENVQRMTTYLNNFSNSMDYELSRSAKIRFLTTYNRNDMTLDTIVSQLTEGFMHQSSARFSRSRGISNDISHTYMLTSSLTDVADFTSTTNMFTTRTTLPIERLHLKIDLKNNATLLSDDNKALATEDDYRSDQYSSDLINSFEWRWKGIKWEPRTQTKYSYNVQKNPDNTSRELDTRFALTSEFPESRIFGKVRTKGEYGWRRRSHEDGHDIKNRYFLDVSLTKKINSHYRLMLLTTQEKETYGGSVDGEPASAVDFSNKNLLKQSYKVDVQANPTDRVNLGASVMVIRQSSPGTPDLNNPTLEVPDNISNITRIGITVSAVIPKLGIPIRSFLISETRALTGLEKQTQLTMETKASYRFRQITVTVVHSLIRENLLTEKFSFHEIRGKISRQFSVL